MKRGRLLVLALSLLFLINFVSAQYANVTPVAVLCSSVYDSSTPCSEAIDGSTNVNNGWFSQSTTNQASASVAPQWIRADIGSVKTVNGIRVYPGWVGVHT